MLQLTFSNGLAAQPLSFLPNLSKQLPLLPLPPGIHFMTVCPFSFHGPDIVVANKIKLLSSLPSLFLFCLFVCLLPVLLFSTFCLHPGKFLLSVSTPASRAMYKHKQPPKQVYSLTIDNTLTHPWKTRYACTHTIWQTCDHKLHTEKLKQDTRTHTHRYCL